VRELPPDPGGRLTSPLPWKDRDSRALGDDLERGRFAVLGRAQRLASPRSHRMPCGNVQCRVHVGMRLAPAGDAPERLTLAVLRSDVPACRAALARVRGIDLLDPAGSLVLQPFQEDPPPVREDGAVQPSLLPDVAARPVDGAPDASRHSPHVQVLDTDQVESAGQIGTHFLRPVATAGRFPALEAGDGKPCPRPTVGTLSLASFAPLQPLEAPPLCRAQVRNREQLPSRQSCRDGHASVNADNFARSRPGNRWRDRRERDVPTASTIPSHPVGLGVGDWARPAESHPAELGNLHFAPAAVEAACVPRFHGDDSEPFVHVVLTPGRRGGMRWVFLRRGPGSSVAPPGQYGIPVCPCGMEVPKSLLLHDHAALRQPWERGACFGELPALLGQSRRWLAAWLPPRALLHRQIPYEPGVSAVPQERCLLGGCRIQAVAAHGRTVASTCDDDGKGAAFLARLEAWRLSAACKPSWRDPGSPGEIPR
jgi:hypothetical protein